MQRGCCFSRVEVGFRPNSCAKTNPWTKFLPKKTKNHPRPHPKRVNRKNKNTKKDPTLHHLREKCARRLSENSVSLSHSSGRFSALDTAARTACAQTPVSRDAQAICCFDASKSSAAVEKYAALDVMPAHAAIL